MINKKRLINLTKKLIAINSENPPGREEKIANFIKARMSKAGIRIIKTYTFVAKRPNVIGILKGGGCRQSLLLSPHMDTVPAGKNWKTNPFAPVIKGNRLFGRGATDCKGNLAVCLEVVQSLIEDNINLKQDLIVAITVDEETGSKQGIIKLLEKKILRPTWAIILDSDDFNVIICQKGLIHFKIEIFGKKAHGAYPKRGINAIEIASEIISELKELKFDFKPHHYLKPPTVNIGKICGGEKVNIVADYCLFEVDLRFLPGMQPKKILSQIKTLLRLKAKNFNLHIDSIQAPYEISPNHPLVKRLLKSDTRFKVAGSEGATVITFFKKPKISAIATGFGSSGAAHITDEYVNLDNLYRGALALERFIKYLQISTNYF
ncbi:MAG: M20 family metallopeptidase [Candidatus Omnitrophota bacterium]